MTHAAVSLHSAVARAARLSGRLVLLSTLVVLATMAVGTLQPAGAQQPATLAGTVVSADDGTPLPLANVVLSGRERGVTTSEEGTFEITGLDPGRYTVSVSYVGYEAYEQDVQLEAGERRTLEVRLTPVDLEVEGVTVTGQRVEEQTLGATRVTPQDIETLPTVLEPDLFRALQLLPGVKAASDFSSGLYIRGGGPEQTLILLDDAPVYNPTHVFGVFSTFHPDAIGDVTLYKGGYPATYGGRLGAVVDIQSRRPENASTRGGVSVGLLSSRAYAEGGFDLNGGGAGGTGRWMVAARRSTIEPLLAGLREANTDNIPDGFYFYDLNAAATYDLTPSDRLTLSLYNGRDQLDYPFLDDAVFDIGYGNRTGTLAWRHLFPGDWTMRWTATASHYYSNPTAAIAGTEFVRDNDVVDLRLQSDVTWSPNEQHLVEGGATVASFASDVDNFFNERRSYSPSVNAVNAAAYVQDTYRPSWASGWTITGGLRASYFQQGDYVRLGPRLTLEYEATDRVRLQAGYGRYDQYLSAATSELFSAFDFWLTADEQVPPAFGDQFLAGVKTRPADGYRADVEVYYRTMRNLFEFDRLRQDYSGLDYADVFLYGTGEAYGAEAMLRKTTGRVTGFVGYTLSRTTRTFDGLAESSFPPRFDRTHDLTAVVNVDLATNWRLTTVFTYATGQAYTEPTGYFKTLDDPFLSQPRTSLQATYNNARLPAYHRLDVGVRRKGSVFGVDYEAQVQLVNAYARRNIWFVLFEPTDNNQIERDVVPQIPVPLPNLSLTLSF